MENVVLENELYAPKTNDTRQPDSPSGKTKNSTVHLRVLTSALVIVTIMFIVNLAATGWLYTQRVDLIQSKNKLLGENSTQSAKLHSARQDAQLFSKKLQSQNEMLVGENKKLKDEIEQLKSQRDWLSSENAAAIDQNAELTGKNEAIAEQLDRTIRAYRKRFDQLKAQSK